MEQAGLHGAPGDDGSLVAIGAQQVRAIAEGLAGRSLELLVEPGRAIAAAAGMLLARVEYLKLGAERNFAVVDAAMNDLLRPALYDAWQDILPVERSSGASP